MKKIDLSIVVPIYNVEEYLEECLESVYPLNISKEIILVNDGSTDNSLKIAEKYKNKYPDETILISQENKGLSGARNTGLDVAKGEYIYFLDSDDFIETEQFECFFRGVDKDIDIVHSHAYFIFNEECRKEKNKSLKFKNLLLNNKDYFRILKDIGYIPAIWLNIYKTEFLKKEKLKFQESLLYEDYHFSYFAFLKAEKIEVNNVNFYNYRQREGSIMSKPKNYKHLLFIVDSFLEYNIRNDVSSYDLWSFCYGTLRDIVKRGKVYNFVIYKKLLLMKGKKVKSYYKLFQLFLKFLSAKNIPYNDIVDVIKNNF